MPKIFLSDVGLRSLQPPLRGAIDFWDTALPSFGCRVSQGGAKTFILKIQNSRRAIGRFPLISLSAARAEAKRLLAEKTLGKIRPQSMSVPQAVEVFLTEKAKSRRPRTVQTLKERLNQHFPFKGQLNQITHQEIARRLAIIKTSPEHDHALAVVKTFFTWAYNRRLITDNPVRGLSPHGHTARSRVLSDIELKLIWEATHEPTTFHLITRLLLLTGQRRGEIAALQFTWIKNDTITIPASVTKNSREHGFPIGAMTAALLIRFPKPHLRSSFPRVEKKHPSTDGVNVRFCLIK